MDVSLLLHVARIEIKTAACKTSIPEDQLYLTGGAIARWRYDLPQSDLDFVTADDPKFDDARLKRTSCVTPCAWTFGRHQILRYKFGVPPESVGWFDLAHAQSWVGVHDFYIAPEIESRTIRFSGATRDPVATLGRMVKWLNLGFTMNKTELVPVVEAIRRVPKELYVDVLASLNLTSTGQEISSDL